MKTEKKPVFAKASGAPFSDEDIQLIGAELLKIANANQVQDLRLLDKNIVFEAIEADPNHPLRQFYDWNVKNAARKHWIAFTQKLITSVRVEWKIGKFTTPVPFTVYAEMPRLKQGTARKRVLTVDAMRNDPVFASVVGARLRNIELQLRQVETLIEARGGDPPSGTMELIDSLRAAFDVHYSKIEAAAE